jgi:hypothetical protein
VSTEEERLEAAGWERWQPAGHHVGVVFWRNPEGALWHAQEEAIALLEGRPAGGGEDERWQEEVRELEGAGWERSGRGPKTLWRNPSSGHWYVHRQAVIMLRREDSGAGSQT